MRSSVCAAILVLVSSVGVADVASAQLVDRGYSLDVVDLPVLGSTRALGLGGAYASAGEGITAMAWNPAATGKRASWETDWFEWEIAFGVMFPTTRNANRFFGAVPGSDVRVDHFEYFDVGLRFQFGPASYGVMFRPRNFEANGRIVGSQIGHMDLAWSFLGGDLVVGAGARIVALTITDGTTDSLEFAMAGASLEAGATYSPEDFPFRAALVSRAPIHARPRSPESVSGFAIPARIVVPWEVNVSFTYGFGERNLNPPMPDPIRPRERRRRERVARAAVVRILEAGDPVVAPTSEEDALADLDPDPRPSPFPRRVPRQRYGIATLDVIVQGRVSNGIGLDGFLSQTPIRWGSRTTVSPRLGVEGEPWRDRLKLRAGAYLEPRRSDLADPRVHLTQGFDFRVFSTDVFGLFDEPRGIQVSFVSDVAKEYFNFGLGVGIWH